MQYLFSNRGKKDAFNITNVCSAHFPDSVHREQAGPPAQLVLVLLEKRLIVSAGAVLAAAGRRADVGLPQLNGPKRPLPLRQHPLAV